MNGYQRVRGMNTNGPILELARANYEDAMAFKLVV